VCIAYIAGASWVIHYCPVTGGIREAQRKFLADNTSYVAILLTHTCDPTTLHRCNKRYDIRMAQSKCKSYKIGICPPTAVGLPVSTQHVISSNNVSDFYLIGFRFKSQLGRRLSWLLFSVISLRPSRKIRTRPFPPTRLEFIIRYKKNLDWIFGTA